MIDQALLATIEIIYFTNVKAAMLANILVHSAAVYYHYHLVLVATISSSVARQEDSQNTHNLILRRVRVTILP